MVLVYKKIYLALNRDVKSSLQGIHGIGLYKALLIESKIGLRNSYFLMNKVNIYLFRMLEQVLHSCTWLKARITRQIFSNISNLIAIKCYKGFRHQDCLPVRGQRTRTNAGTQKKKRGMRFIKKHHFKFNYSKNRCAYIIYKQTHSNFFLTLIDRKGHVINCVTAGNSHVGFSIRQKRSPYAMEKICSRLMIFMRLYKICNLHIYLKTRPTSAFFMFMRQLSLHRIRVIRIIEVISAPHNGVRAKKLRRK